MIKEDYVSFETAKLLKEKGFDEKCRYYYPSKPELFLYKDCTNTGTMFDKYACTAPTQSLAMRWLREVHNIQVQPYAMSLGWYFDVFNLNECDITGCAEYYSVGIPKKEDCFDTYEQACEAAIKYCLENLI